MNVLPSPSVTKSELQTALSKHYHLGRLLSYKKMKKGLANSIYRLRTAKGDFTLKIAIRNNPVRIRYEIDLLAHLRHLPTPRPLMTKQKKYFFDYKGHKSFVYPFLSGEEKHNFTAAMLRQVGLFLGKLHLQTRGFQSSVKRMELYNIPPKDLKVMIKSSRILSHSDIQEALSYLEANTLKHALPSTLPQGAMHIDLKPENTLFAKGKLTGVVDFDNSYIGPLVLDLANTMMWFSSNSGRFDTKKARAIYQGYRTIRKLTKEERRSLFDALHYAFVSHVLVDIYFLALKKLPKSYIFWGLKHLLETEKNLKFTKTDFSSILN